MKKMMLALRVVTDWVTGCLGMGILLNQKVMHLLKNLGRTPPSAVHEEVSGYFGCNAPKIPPPKFSRAAGAGGHDLATPKI